jgi:hypothetical protein
VVYCADKSLIKSIDRPLTPSKIDRYYVHRDEEFEKRGPYRRQPLEAAKSMDERKNLRYTIIAPDGKKIAPGYQWLWEEDRFKAALKENDIEFLKTDNGWSIQYKQYLRHKDGTQRNEKQTTIFSSEHTLVDSVGQADPLVAWAKSMTDGYGVDSSLDCLPPGASAAAFMRPLFALRRGGRAITVGAVMETLPLNAFWLMTNRIGLQGSVWFTTGEGEDMAAMVAAGTLDVSPLEHRIFPMSQVNDAMVAMNNRNGGFTNFIVDPTRAG